MPIAHGVKAFFNSFMICLPQLLPRSDHPPSSSSSTVPTAPSIVDSESQPVSALNTNDQQNRSHFLLQWQNVVLAFCFTSALEVAVLSAQTESRLSLSFHLLSFVILLIFLSLFVENFIRQKFLVASQVLEKVAILLGATSFILTVTIPFPLSLKIISWALYAFCLLIIAICNSFYKQL